MLGFPLKAKAPTDVQVSWAIPSTWTKQHAILRKLENLGCFTEKRGIQPALCHRTDVSEGLRFIGDETLKLPPISDIQP